MDTKWSVWIHTWQTQIDYRITPWTDLADGCVLVKPCSDHIFAVGNPDCFHKQVSPCWDSQPQVQLFRLLSHMRSGLKWPILANVPGPRINQVKQVRSESRLTNCPFLIKFNGKINQIKTDTTSIVTNVLLCCELSVVFNVITYIDVVDTNNGRNLFVRACRCHRRVDY